MAQVGVGLDTLEHHYAELLRQLGITFVEFRIGREQAMLGEADSVEAARTACGGLDV